ncbi:MAG: hypothetical protein PHI44_03170 [Candidatus Ratteibacteria bacterium]|nr:hypothetical protein [Candidatus Ratteibacteria bacterium]
MKRHKGRKRSLPTVVILMAIVWTFLCLYVWLSCKIVAIGYKMEEAKKMYEEAHMLNQNYKAEVLRLSSPEYLLKITRNAGIELVNPSAWCYVDIMVDDTKGNRNDTAEAGIH